MTKENLKKEVLKKITKLNRKIDMLILNGKSYTKEAKIHRNLVNMLNSVQ